MSRKPPHRRRQPPRNPTHLNDRKCNLPDPRAPSSPRPEAGRLVPRAVAGAVWRRGAVARHRFRAGDDCLDQISRAGFSGRLSVADLWPGAARRRQRTALWFLHSRGARRDALDFCALEPDAAMPCRSCRWSPRTSGILACSSALVGILLGDSTGFAWLEFPRGGSVLLFAAFLLIAISAVATFGQRRERELYPVALVFARGAVVVPVDLLNGQSVPRRRDRCAASRRWRLIFGLPTICSSSGSVWSESAQRFISCRNSFPAAGIAKSLPRAVRVLDADSFRHLDGHCRRSPLPAWMPALSSPSPRLTIVPAAGHRHHRGGRCGVRWHCRAWRVRRFVSSAPACGFVSVS